MKIYFSIILLITSFISGIHSLSLVNNVSVSSDVFSQMFLAEIKSNPNKLYASGPDFGQYNSKECLVYLREIIKRYPGPEVAQYFDAWGNIPAGVSTGNQYDLGNYDQCVKSSLSFNEIDSVIRQQYCFAKLPLKQEPLRGILEHYLDPSFSINVGICVPENCSPELLTSIFKESTKTNLDGALSGISIERCSDGQIPPLTTSIIVCIYILVILTGLLILSSSYDIYARYYQKKPSPVLMTFSIFTNGKRLFAINTKRSRSTIDCLTGFRVISTLWIIHFHTYTNVFTNPVINYMDLSAWFSSWEFMPIFNANISVDTFFFMGGLLVAWVGFKELDKTNGKINFFMNIVHRYIRLTPILAAGLVLAYSVNKIIYTGPFKEQFMAMNNCNGYSWVPIMLYIQNYNSEHRSLGFDACYSETWYLAVDFQLYALSPLILIPMWKWGKKFGPVLIVIGLTSIAWIIGIYLSEEFTGLMLGVNPHEWQKVYITTHTRLAPWLIGVGFGYFMHKNRQSEFQISNIFQIIGWVGSLFTMTAIVFIPYFTLNTNGKGTVFEAAIYESLKRVSWALALSWITFTCHYGYGGIVNAFLSHPLWQPFARLSYAIYMMHMAIIRMHYGMARTQIYFSVYNQFLYFWSGIGMTLLVSVYVSFVFESPVLALEKIVFSREKPMENENKVQSSLTNIVDRSSEKDS